MPRIAEKHLVPALCRCLSVLLAHSVDWHHHVVSFLPVGARRLCIPSPSSSPLFAISLSVSLSLTETFTHATKTKNAHTQHAHTQATTRTQPPLSLLAFRHLLPLLTTHTGFVRIPTTNAH